LVKLNADGTVGWQKDLGNAGTLSNPNVSVAAWYLTSFDPAGNVIVTGPSDITNGPPVAITTKFDANGDLLWTYIYDKSFAEGEGVIPDAITTDGRGNIFVATLT